MFQDILGRIALGWLRHGVSVFGGYMVAHGLLTAAQSEQASGALLTLLPLMFSALDKYQQQQAANSALLKAAQEAQTNQAAKLSKGE